MNYKYIYIYIFILDGFNFTYKSIFTYSSTLILSVYDQTLKSMKNQKQNILSIKRHSHVFNGEKNTT